MEFKNFVKPFKNVSSFILVSLALGMINSFFFNSQLTLQGFLIGTLWSFAIWTTQWVGHAYLAHIITRRFPWKKYKWKTIIIRVFTIVFYSLFAFFIVQIGLIRLFYGSITREILLDIISTFPYVLGISFFISLVIAILEFSRNWKKTVLEYEKTKAEMMTYKYDSLRNQINPHFLFNSLNVLSDLVIEDQKIAVKFIRQLSLLYRYVLDSSQKELISVQEEFEFIGSYKFLLETRFEKGLEIQIPEQESKDWIVPLSVQLLIENAVKHNVVSEDRPLYVSINFEDDYLVVKNNFQPKETGERTSGKGLDNIIARYQFFTEKQVSISQDFECFIVKIPLLEKA